LFLEQSKTLKSCEVFGVRLCLTLKFEGRDTSLRGRNEGGKGGTIPQAPSHYEGVESLRGAPNDCGGRRKVPTISQVLSSLQYICFRKISVSNTVAPDLLLALGVI